MPRDSNQMTAGVLETELRRLARRLTDDPMNSRSNTGDRDLDALASLHDIAVTVDTMIDQRIVLARRREHERQPPASWAAIGDAIGMTGQAAGKRARSRGLHVAPLTPERYRELVEKGLRLVDGESR